MSALDVSLKNIIEIEYVDSYVNFTSASLEGDYWRDRHCVWGKAVSKIEDVYEALQPGESRRGGESFDASV